MYAARWSWKPGLEVELDDRNTVFDSCVKNDWNEPEDNLPYRTAWKTNTHKAKSVCLKGMNA
jgi:hypothetical protein